MMKKILLDYQEKVPLLFECCRPVKGAFKGAIFDLQRERYISVPNDLIDVLTSPEQFTVQERMETLSHSDQNVYLDYLNHLNEIEYIFFVDKDQCSSFPKLNTSWQFPAEISNAIIEFDDNSQHEIKKILEALEQLGCRGVEIRFYQRVTTEEIVNILEELEATGISSVVIKCNYNSEIYTSQFVSLLNKRFFTLHLLEVYGFDSEKIVIDNISLNVVHYKSEFLSSAHCGFISQGNFILNQIFFLEAMNFNSCLNRKLAIDKYGLLKNCPAMNLDFGHHKEVSIIDTVRQDEFQKNWNITKDDISICSKCEFRYVCLDCRAFTQVPSNEFTHGKPKKCNYDPFTGKWN